MSKHEQPGILAVDIGNTNIHIGLWQAGTWRYSWRARTVTGKTADEYAVLLRSFLASEKLKTHHIEGVAIGSVVPALTGTWAMLAQDTLELEPLVVNHQTKVGIRIEIDQPEQAGADRIINAAAAYKLFGGAAIVVDFGTATNFDVVSGNGAYRGGAIAPGLNIAHDALVARAARLHKVDLRPPGCIIGTNTIAAMQSGIFVGHVAMVEGLVARIKREMHEPDVKVIGTGGLAPLFQANTDCIDLIAPELTLDGLRIIYEMNH